MGTWKPFFFPLYGKHVMGSVYCRKMGSKRSHFASSGLPCYVTSKISHRASPPPPFHNQRPSHPHPHPIITPHNQSLPNPQFFLVLALVLVLAPAPPITRKSIKTFEKNPLSFILSFISGRGASDITTRFYPLPHDLYIFFVSNL